MNSPKVFENVTHYEVWWSERSWTKGHRAEQRELQDREDDVLKGQQLMALPCVVCSKYRGRRAMVSVGSLLRANCERDKSFMARLTWKEVVCRGVEMVGKETFELLCPMAWWKTQMQCVQKGREGFSKYSLLLVGDVWNWETKWKRYVWEELGFIMHNEAQ